MPKFLVFLFLSVTLFFDNSFAQKQNLDYYIIAGLKNSPLLKDYNNQFLSLTYDSLIIKAGGKPQVNIVSEALYAPATNKYGYDSAITNGGNYSAVVNINQPLLYNKTKSLQSQALNLLGQSLQLNSKISEIDLKKNITAQYLSAFADYSQFQFNQSIIILLKEQLSIMKELVQKGVYLQTDYLNLSLSIRNQEIAVKQYFIQYKNNLGLLNFTCGITDTSIIDIAIPDIRLKNDFSIDSSPLMMQLKIDSLKNISGRSLVDLNYRPKLNAFADAGFNSINPTNIPNNLGVSIGLMFSMPIYDGHQRKSQYGKISLLESTRLSFQQFYISQFNQQVIQLKDQLKLTDDLISSINEQLTEQRKLIDLYKIEIEKGLVRFIDFLTVVNNYSLAKFNLTQAEINRMQIINQMNYLK